MPIYSRCFSDICRRSTKEPVLFAALLAALRNMVDVGSDEKLQTIPFDTEEAIVIYNENHVASIEVEDLILMFHYDPTNNLVIAAAVSPSETEFKEEAVIEHLLFQVDKFMRSYQDTNWQAITTELTLQLEASLLDQIVYKFFADYDLQNACSLKDNCFYRLALYEGYEPTISGRLSHKIDGLKHLTIWRRLMMKLSSSNYPIPVTR